MWHELHFTVDIMHHVMKIEYVYCGIDKRGGRGLETRTRTVHCSHSDVTSANIAAFRVHFQSLYANYILSAAFPCPPYRNVY